jgi:hypothetical protein
MRTRSRAIPSSQQISYLVKKLNTLTGVVTDHAGNQRADKWNYNCRSESISDETNDPRRKDWKARLKRNLERANRILDPVLRNSVKSDFYTAAQECHNCSHTKTYMNDETALVTSQSGSSIYYHTWNGGHALYRKGALLAYTSTNKDYLLNFAGSISHSGSSNAYHGPDWFALLDRWHESCNSLMPSASLLGESMVEHAIFVDAFKAILNPSRAVRSLLEFALKFRRKKAFRQRVGVMLRTSADSYLGYNFGIKPALQELELIFNAHKLVQKRLNFLRENRGGYVPVRVGTKIPSEFTNTYPGTSTILKHLDAKETIAVISALAKVRTDLDFASDWKAYVQYFGLHKFIGLAWELVPFSFVVDWVTNAGDYISRYTTPHFASPYYNMRNLCHSVKQRSIWKLIVPSGYSFNEGWGTVNSDHTVLRGETSTYSRARGLPSTAGKVDFSLLGTFHGITSSALLFQKSRIGR